MAIGSERLTHDERTCLQLAARGHNASAISGQIEICEQKVMDLLASAREKLMATNTMEAVARALNLGLIQ